jgi:hypothetical protein
LEAAAWSLDHFDHLLILTTEDTASAQFSATFWDSHAIAERNIWQKMCHLPLTNDNQSGSPFFCVLALKLAVIFVVTQIFPLSQSCRIIFKTHCTVNLIKTNVTIHDL